MIRKLWEPVDTWLVDHPWVAVLAILAGAVILVVSVSLSYPCR